MKYKVTFEPAPLYCRDTGFYPADPSKRWPVVHAVFIRAASAAAAITLAKARVRTYNPSALNFHTASSR